MKLSVKALAITAAVLWGGAILLTGVGNLIAPGYGIELLDLAASIYPGYEVGGPGSIVVGTLYAAVDGAVFGGIFAWLYNRVLRDETATAPTA